MSDNKLNIILVLAVLLAGSNGFLCYKLMEVGEDAESAKREAGEAASYAKSAKMYAEYAWESADEATNYAKSAKSYAEDAYYQANEASVNAFGNVCSYCPSSRW